MNLRQILWLAVAVAVVPLSAGHARQPFVETKLDGLAVAVEVVTDKDHQYLRLYLENTTSQPVVIQDYSRPAFTAETWFSFQADGKPLHVSDTAAYAVKIKPVERTIQPKSKMYFGKAILREFGPVERAPYTRSFGLKPGNYALEVSSNKGVKPGKLEVTVPDKPAPGKSPGAAHGPGEAKLTGLKVVAEPVVDKQHQYLRLYLENTTAKPMEIQDSSAPAFTVDEWFSFQVDGKQVDVAVPGVHSFQAAKKRMVPAKSKTYLGKAILHDFGSVERDGYTPELALKPGKHTLEVGSKPGITPAKLDVTVVAGPAPSALKQHYTPVLALAPGKCTIRVIPSKQARESASDPCWRGGLMSRSHPFAAEQHVLDGQRGFQQQ